MTAQNSPSILEGVPEGGGSKEPVILQEQARGRELLRRFAPPPLQEEEFWGAYFRMGLSYLPR